MKKASVVIAAIAVSVASSAALAQYNVRGGFNGWGESPMNDDGDGSYSLTVGSLAGTFEWKIAQNDWAFSAPGDNARSAPDGGGSFTFHFIPNPAVDGWNPASNRVGYDDPGVFGWEIQGSFNNWDGGVDTAARQMSNMGGGLYSVDYTIASAGNHLFKFRKSNDWDVSIGNDFSNYGHDIGLTTGNPNEIWRFELDLPNGRWRTTLVPEPGTMALIGLGAVAFIRHRRRTR